MTDHLPNDLSHLSEEEFCALCPQGEHAPGPSMADLSPAAQAVLDAFLAEWPDEALEQDRRCLAAALRAAADLIYPDWDARCCYEVLKAIADELEGHDLP
jgi:hypothetical protein